MVLVLELCSGLSGLRSASTIDTSGRPRLAYPLGSLWGGHCRACGCRAKDREAALQKCRLKPVCQCCTPTVVRKSCLQRALTVRGTDWPARLAGWDLAGVRVWRHPGVILMFTNTLHLLSGDCPGQCGAA